jgi:hypothetical protein
MASLRRTHHPPSRWNTVGIALAIIAGLTTIAFAQWPIASPQGRGNLGALWGVGVWIIGFMNFTAAFLVDQNRLLAKSMLTTGALWLAGSALVATEILRTPTLTWLAAVVDLLPAAIALAAAMLIGPVAMSEDEQDVHVDLLPLREHRAEERELDQAA